jgi:eukaryotic-like serine/threonine-protein kinase
MLGATDERSLRAERRVGRTLGDKWRLDRLIGMGGMAAVYAATHTNNQRAAAIKVLHREFSTKEDIRKRFLREGYIANKVGHPGAVTVLDDGTDEDGSVFLVMDLFHGETLHARATAGDGTLPVLEVLRITESLLDVLAAAHDAGVIHRDLKPENIFVTDEGDVKVLDFGIARLLEAKSDLTTQAGMLVGTPTFMPPEQIAGKMELIDGRTDLWAVGAMMFTLLSGKLVHEAKSGNALLLHAMTAPARSLSDVLPEVHPSVRAVVDRALAFERQDRWPDARAMQLAVREALATGAPRKGAPKTEIDLESHAPSSATVATKRSLVGRRSFAALVAVLLLGLTGAFGAWMRRHTGSLSLGSPAGPASPAATDDIAAGGDGGAENSRGDNAALAGTDGGLPDGDSDSGDDDAGDGYEEDDGGEYDEDDEEDDGGFDEEDADGAVLTAPPSSAANQRGTKPSPAASHRLPPKKPLVHKPLPPTPRKPRRKKRRPRW